MRYTRARDQYRHAVAELDNVASAVRLARELQTIISDHTPAGLLVTPDQWMDSASSARRLGVLPGTFNPLTRAHIALAKSARSASGLDAILWVLPVASIGKETVERACLVDRVTQMRAYAEGSGDALMVVNRGLYVEQALIIKKLIQTSTQLVFITGFDRLAAILDARYYTDRDASLDLLFARADLLVAPRNRDSRGDLVSLLERAENQRYRNRVQYCPLARAYLGDSSSEARTLSSSKSGNLRMRALLAPEGLALVRLPDVYRLAVPGGAGVTVCGGDAYLERLHTLERLSASDSIPIAHARFSEMRQARRSTLGERRGARSD